MISQLIESGNKPKDTAKVKKLLNVSKVKGLLLCVHPFTFFFKLFLVCRYFLHSW